MSSRSYRPRGAKDARIAAKLAAELSAPYGAESKPITCGKRPLDQGAAASSVAADKSPKRTRQRPRAGSGRHGGVGGGGGGGGGGSDGGTTRSASASSSTSSSSNDGTSSADSVTTNERRGDSKVSPPAC